MNDFGPEALARLREIRDALGQDDAPHRVNLRDYAEPGSPAWEAFVEASGLPGHKVRRPTMLARINQAIDALTAQLLGAEPPAQAPDPTPSQPDIQRLATAIDDGLGQARPIERQRLRRLTSDGIQLARQFLADLRESSTGPIEPPRQLLYDERYAQPFVGDVEVGRRPFRTRRDAAEYLAPRLEPIKRLVTDHAGVWSWLGMFYFAETVRRGNGTIRLSPLNETFVVDGSVGRSYLLRYRHYLWGSWRLYDSHVERAAFLLDQDLTSFGDLAERAFGSVRIFNSLGVVPLMLRLYTNEDRQKAGFGRSRGGLRHLIRVLDQLERTYDVYGMEPDALLRILPDEFRSWDGGPGPDR